MRSDENLSRPSFRFSPEWKRTREMENLSPQIDARLAGVERRGDQLFVHSLSGNERNHYFANRRGRSFQDLSAVSGLDTPADSRGFALIDYDRDGWQDIALVNANEPLFNLYHNEMPAAGLSGGIIAIRFVGGNRSASTSTEFSCRDGYGARVTVDLGEMRLIREHRCGDGFATQNTATMLLGIGARPNAASITIRWPSGKTTSTADVPEGTLLTAYENPADAPASDGFVRSPYRVKPAADSMLAASRPVFPVAAADVGAKPGARLRVYTSFATWCLSCKKHLPTLRRLREELGPEGVDFVAVPIDETDDNPKLAAYARDWRPSSRLMALAPNKRKEAGDAFSKALGEEAPLPCTVITDGSGRFLSVQTGVPSVSALRQMLQRVPAQQVPGLGD